ncbi:hypothetical protein F5887DRAFT_1019494 [Amanita rubescens]|nr:hypothetical protein F5887DRAFT_1019494 [Amanita rubescens]
MAIVTSRPIHRNLTSSYWRYAEDKANGLGMRAVPNRLYGATRKRRRWTVGTNTYEGPWHVIERNPATSVVHVCLPPTPLYLVWSLLLQTCLSTWPHLPRLPPNLLPTEKIVAAVLLPLFLLVPPHDWRPYFPLTRHGLDPLSRYRYFYPYFVIHPALPTPLAHSILLMNRLHKEIGKENSVEVDVTLVHDKSSAEDIASRRRVSFTPRTMDDP